jgi:HSP20 family protein
MKESNRERYEKKIKELEKRIRKLEKEREKKKTEPEKGQEETNSAEILRSIGRMFGLGGLIKSAEKLPEFQERLKEVDEELRRKLKTAPLKKPEGRISYQKRQFKPRSSGRGKPPRKKETSFPRKKEVDIFDEDNYILAIVEIPGAEEKGLKVNLEKDKLAIFADKTGKKYHKEIILPCMPEGKITRTYKNGILEIKIMKNAK